MLFVSHRINTVKELQKVPLEYGVEVDLRDHNGTIYMQHDPYITEHAEMFEAFLKHYHHRFIILNIKSERIEWEIIKLLQKYGIEDYFFLDSSFPMTYQLLRNGENNIAIRFSEYEPIDMALKLSPKWVWVDCFTCLPLDAETYKKLRNNNVKICIVSPELQNQDSKLEQYATYMKENDIIPDMICTKSYNIVRWMAFLER